MGSMSRFQYGDGSPTPYVYELLRLISKFLVSGPDFDKEENLAKNRRPRINLLSLYCADHYEKRSEEALRNGDAPSKLSYFLDDWIRRLLGYRGFSIFRQFAAGVDYVKLYENGKLLAKWDVKSNMTYMKEFMKQKEIAQWDPGYDSSTFYRAYPDYKPTAWEMEED